MHVPSLLHVVGGLAAAAILARAGAARAADPGLRADLEAVARRSVLFGHQSVGANILDGLRDLAVQEGVPLRIVEVQSAQGLSPGTCGHVLVAENGAPLRKLQSFEHALGDRPAPVDVALLKFCYVDLLAGADAKMLFERYQGELRALRARHPRTTFLRVTAPLTTIPTGPKAFVKRLIGRDHNREDNAVREEFNRLVRGAWQGPEPLFDLARLESTRPDGGTEAREVGGKQVPVLVPAYSDDGGHLNAEGRRRVARELLRLLASVPGQDAAATAAGSK